MIGLIKDQFGIHPTNIKELWGYDNLNYLVTTNDAKYVFKTYPNDPETFKIINAENELLEFIQVENGKYPLPFKFKDGSKIKVIEIDGKERICRMLSYLDGEFLGDINPTETVFRSIGKMTAELDRKLLSFHNSAIKARQWNWDLQYLHLNDNYMIDISDAKDRSLVEYFFQQYDENVLPYFNDLRKSIIHGDVNEWNMLIKKDAVNGFIDFGDICYTPLINELAIVLAYACLYIDDPVKWSGYIIEAYNKILPLKEQELAVLYYLIPVRLCISVCNSAYARKVDPSNKYKAISEELAWKLLRKWLTVNPIEFENHCRELCGFKKDLPAKVDKALKERQKLMAANLSVSYNEPIYVTRSAFQYMYDVYGNTYLDAYNNIPHVGHSHPRVVRAGQRQMAKLNTNTRYIYDILHEYSHALLAKFPEQLNKIFFVNSGSAASDLAIRLAVIHTGYENLMVMEHGYHGNTQAAMDISDYKFSSVLGSGQKHNILKTTLPDIYRGKYNETDAGNKYAHDAIEEIKSFNQPLAAFISEPVVGCGGQIPLANGYLKELYPTIRAQGGVCISDEVQTGFGRLGKHFWGYEAQDVEPDIVIIGKPMGNGHPMAAVVTTKAITDSFSKGVEFFSSFGGNPVSCTIGLAVLNVIEEEQLQQNAKVVGDYYIEQLRQLQKQHECIGDVRGFGLFIGIDFIKDRSTKEPATEIAQLVKNELRRRYILVDTDGPFDNVIKSKPPLCFNKSNVDEVVITLDKILKSI